ncbi:WXG100 family type VII secretion target [Actinomadura sp. DC4]|uniref:WXG100 family type VII secretion target n=1 Tax=Actinomadura sp. DC4 TaxID=3055069 RepID=UPI0025AF5827|nr:WXG100 family type VII secretion target [Actinomadura sp. DC4]MDN3357079.1 WXG100 family type VII secretion target [Actinomadura sp. DC4]
MPIPPFPYRISPGDFWPSGVQALVARRQAAPDNFPDKTTKEGSRMSDVIGGSPEQMQQLARIFGKHSQGLQALIKDLNGHTVNSDAIWKGDHATKFRASWQEAKASFDKMAAALQEADRFIKSKAQSLDQWQH